MRPQPRYNPGDRIGGRYRVHKALMGGMGEVYLCLDEKEMNPYALKTFQPRYFDSNALRKTFEEEVKTWIALEKHSNIVQCHYMNTVESTPFMFLQWIAGHPSKGTSLREWLRYGPLDLKTALEVTIGILRGLRHADAKSPGIVHRDLKPDNILMLEDGTPKITDFGLAKSVGAAKDVSPDGETDSGGFGGSMRVGEVVGTPPYMPPEQWRGEMPDFRADVYAVGCILYEMLTGKMAFPVPEGVTTQSEYIQWMREVHSTGKRPQLPESIPAELNTLIGRCLEADSAKRPESVTALLDELAILYETQVGTPPPEELPAGKLTKFEYGNRGVTFANLKEYERALADFDEVIRLHPTSAQAYSSRGLSYSKMGNPQRAIEDYDEAIRLDPTYAAAYSNRGASYAEMGQFERALADHNEAIRLDPTLAQAYYNRGLSYAKLGNPQRAIGDHDAAIRLDPTDAAAYSNRGASYAEVGQSERALADYDEAIRLDPTLAQAYHNRGLSYANLGQFNRAIADHNEAIRLDPTLAQAYHNRGNSYANMGQFERALADYDEAIRLDPTDAQAYLSRGISYANMDQSERAIVDCDEAIRLDPTLAKAYTNRGNSYYNLGQSERAIADFDKAIRLNPTFAEAYFNKGAALFNNGRAQEALPLFEKAYELGIQQALGAIQQVRGALGLPPMQVQAAFEAFQRAASPDAMRQAVAQFPVLAQMIPTIEQVIQTQVPPEARPAFEQRLAWLKQIVGEGQ